MKEDPSHGKRHPRRKEGPGELHRDSDGMMRMSMTESMTSSL